jgi:hypothetical protein
VLSIVEIDLSKGAEIPYLAVTEMGHQPETCKRYPNLVAAVALPAQAPLPFYSLSNVRSSRAASTSRSQCERPLG